MATKGHFGASAHGHVGTVLCGAVSPDGDYIVSGSDDTTIRIWGVKTREELDVLYGHSSAVTSLTFTPDGKRIISGSHDGSIRVWGVDRETLAKAEENRRQKRRRSTLSTNNVRLIYSER